MSTKPKAYPVGGGMGSLAAAAFMIRDGDVPGENISILEAMPVPGGSLDGAEIQPGAYSMRGGRMLTTDNYECTWDPYKSIPSLVHPGRTVLDEMLAFNEMHEAHSLARLVDGRRAKVPVTSMGFSTQDRIELLKLGKADEEAMGASPITDWLSPGFFESGFWYM
jgi:oleate hydratase